MKVKTRKKIVRFVAAVALIGMAVLVWRQTPPSPTTAGMQEFYSDDNGRTWFPDDGAKIPPFDHNGKPAVLAMVYRCAAGQMFVGYLEKFGDPSNQRIEKKRLTPGILSTTREVSNTLLIKKPGDSEWISETDPKAAAVKIVVCPGGGTDYERVVP